MNYWLAIGPASNWEIVIKRKTWGVSPRNSKAWDRIRPCDTVFFYVMAPIKGLVGYAKVFRTKLDERPLWPQEISDKQCYWPFRVSFEETKAISRKDWETGRIASGREGIVFQRAFQSVDHNRGQSWLEALEQALR